MITSDVAACSKEYPDFRGDGVVIMRDSPPEPQPTAAELTKLFMENYQAMRPYHRASVGRVIAQLLREERAAFRKANERTLVKSEDDGGKTVSFTSTPHYPKEGEIAPVVQEKIDRIIGFANAHLAGCDSVRASLGDGRVTFSRWHPTGPPPNATGITIAQTSIEYDTLRLCSWDEFDKADYPRFVLDMLTRGDKK